VRMVAALLLAMALSGCMTVVGAVTSPFTTTAQVFGAINEERRANRWDPLTTAGGAVVYVLVIPAVMLVPPMVGLEKDVDLLLTGSYSTEGTKRLQMVFTPWQLIGTRGVAEIYDSGAGPTTAPSSSRSEDP
jgi:hypothetical protein